MSVSPKLQLQQLVLIQSLDDEIADHRKLLAEIPLQIESGRTELEEKKRILSVAINELDALQKKRKDLELEVQGENDHMAKAKTKLPAVKTNKEYTAILNEVEAITKNISGLEDQELEIMEILEEKEKVVPDIEKLYKEEDTSFQKYKAKKDTETERMEQELVLLLAKREEVSGKIEKIVVQRYEKISKSREGRAVVSLSGNICQGCFQQILPQMVINVKVGESIQQCSNCIRFLYWEDVPKTATPK
ncbi:MAG TPA: hypothetical protein EYF96_02365 [Nitrospinaceae bacterium]|jgi:predicted  nucleic acid-binding Zn-ribbon protein|nr:hypothetical protein [Nitrospinaceae bacterium]